MTTIERHTLIEKYVELERKLIAVDMGRIKSMLMTEWILENCPHYASRALKIWAERLEGTLGEEQTVRRLEDIIIECIKQAKKRDLNL